MDAIQLLKADHDKVKELLAALTETTTRAVKKRADLLAEISMNLKAHNTIEEEIFYPAFKQAGEKDEAKMYYEPLEEHRAAGDLVNASLQGANIKLVGSSMSQLVFQLWAAKEITEVPQLKGKMLAGTTPRSVLEIATREILKKHGLDFETDYKLIYVQSVPAILTAISSGRVAAGALSAPTTLKARDAGLMMLVDISKANVPGLPLAYGFTGNFLKNYPNSVSAFLKGAAEAVALVKSNPAAAKRAIAKFTKTEDAKIVDDTYDFYAPYFVTNLALKPEQLQTWFSYLDEKEYPQAAKANPADFYDNSFVAALEKSGFFRKLNQSR